MNSLFETYLKLTGYDIRRAGKELKQIQALPPDEFQKWQSNKKWEIARYHYDNNPFYRKKIGDHFPAKWEDLPVMEKSDYQDDLENLLSNGYNRKNTYIANTSGSSGHPFFYAKNKEAHAMTWAFIQKRYSELGIGKNAKEARFYGIPKEFKGLLTEKTKDYLMNRVRFPVFDFSDEMLDTFVTRFSKTKFKYVYGYTNSIVQFSRYLIENNIKLVEICPTLKIAVVTAEVCTKEDRKIIEKGFGLPVVDEYGASEFGYIAWECKIGNWHVAEENIFLESDENRKILITDLFNRAYPFIRYDIGDIGSISNHRCQCGSKKRMLNKIQGRTNNWAILQSGKKSPGLTFYYVARSILESTGVLNEFIIRQTKLDEFVFEIVSDRDLKKEEEKIIQTKMDEYLEPNLNLIIQRVKKINRPESAKIQHFYSEII